MVQSFECRQMLDTLQMISKASFGGIELILMASRFNETKWIESTWIFPGSSGSCRDFRERDESCRKNPSRNGRIDSGDEPREKKTTNQRRHQTKSTHRSAPQIVALISSNKKETNKQKRRRRTEKKVRKKKRETESALWSCPVVIPLFFSIPVSSSGFYSSSEAFYWVFTGFSSLLQNRLQVGPGTRWD